MDLDAHPDILLVRKHLVEHLGPPDEVFEVSGSPIPDSPVQALNLAYFAPAGPQSPVVFATCGACLFTMKDGRRVEAMMVLRREPTGAAFDAVHRLLASFALFAEANDEVVRIGDVVRAQDELSGFSQMDAVLFMPPVPFVPSFHHIDISKGNEVELVWILPVYDSEAQYALKHGPQALMMLFAAQNLDLTVMERDEANTLVDPKDAEVLAQHAIEENKKRASDQSPTPMMTTKLKSSRRDQGRGSFDVAEAGGEVRVARRGAKKPKPKPELVVPDTKPSPEPEPPPRAAPPMRRHPPAGRPLSGQTAAKKDEVRFDLKSGAVQRRSPDSKEVEASRPSIQKDVPLPTIEDQAALKKKRIDELKAHARAAAKRAAARETGELDAVDPTELAEPPRTTDTAPRAAAKRRGAPKRAIKDHLGHDD